MVLLRLIDFLGYLIQLYVYIVIASVILSWLMAFGVVNPYNPTVRAIWQGAQRRHRAAAAPDPQHAAQHGRHRPRRRSCCCSLCFFVQSVVLGSLSRLSSPPAG